MYKNFSYVFGLGALLMLVGCGDGDKQSTAGKQETAAESEGNATEQKKIESIKKISSEEQSNDEQTSKETRNSRVYDDINEPIEDLSELNESEIEADTDVKANHNESVAKKVTESQENNVLTNTESTDSAPGGAGVEPENHDQNDDTKDTADSNTSHPEVHITDEIVNNIDHEESTEDALREKTETAAETPEVHTVSDALVVSEESHEEPSFEIEQNSESTTNTENAHENKPDDETEDD